MKCVIAVILAAGCGGSSGEPIPDSGACLADPIAPGGGCPSTCASCDGATCHIMCGPADCNDTTITCPPDFDCDITCNGGDACDTTKIKCPPDYACQISCTTYDSCGDVRVQCGAGPCSMTCNGPAASCGGASIDCATGGKCGATCNGTSGPSIDCAGACECTPC